MFTRLVPPKPTQMKLSFEKMRDHIKCKLAKYCKVYGQNKLSKATSMEGYPGFY